MNQESVFETYGLENAPAPSTENEIGMAATHKWEQDAIASKMKAFKQLVCNELVEGDIAPPDVTGASMRPLTLADLDALSESVCQSSPLDGKVIPPRSSNLIYAPMQSGKTKLSCGTMLNEGVTKRMATVYTSYDRAPEPERIAQDCENYNRHVQYVYGLLKIPDRQVPKLKPFFLHQGDEFIKAVKDLQNAPPSAKLIVPVLIAMENSTRMKSLRTIILKMLEDSSINKDASGSLLLILMMDEADLMEKSLDRSSAIEKIVYSSIGCFNDMMAAISTWIRVTATPGAFSHSGPDPAGRVFSVVFVQACLYDSCTWGAMVLSGDTRLPFLLV